MQKIKILTDSASDISIEQAKEADVKVIGFHILINDKSYREGIDFTTKEFYDILENSEELPHTSQITVEDYFSEYEKHYKLGYTHIINITISSIGSNSYNNALMARDDFYLENPDAKDKFEIIVVDSKSYTGAYGFAILEAAKKVKNGDSVEQIISFLEDWFDSVIIVCTAFTLKYARKSGRVGTVTAFVGEALGIKPIITFTDAVSETVDKVRGNKMVIPKLFECAKNKMIPGSGYAILVGSNKDHAKELANYMTKETGRKPEYYIDVGATIACHLGHDVAGVIIKSEKRTY